MTTKSRTKNGFALASFNENNDVALSDISTTPETNVHLNEQNVPPSACDSSSGQTSPVRNESGIHSQTSSPETEKRVRKPRPHNLQLRPDQPMHHELTAMSPVYHNMLQNILAPTPGPIYRVNYPMYEIPPVIQTQYVTPIHANATPTPQPTGFFFPTPTPSEIPPTSAVGGQKNINWAQAPPPATPSFIVGTPIAIQQTGTFFSDHQRVAPIPTQRFAVPTQQPHQVAPQPTQSPFPYSVGVMRMPTAHTSFQQQQIDPIGQCSSQATVISPSQLSEPLRTTFDSIGRSEPLTSDKDIEPRVSCLCLSNTQNGIFAHCELPVDSREIAAEVVGKKGRELKKIEQRCGVKIIAPEQQQQSTMSTMANRPNELFFVIRGRPESVLAAKNEVVIRIRVILDSQKKRINAAKGRKGQVIQHLPVSCELVSYIVGNSGHKINRIADETNTYILSPKEDRDAVFHIVGKLKDCQEACAKINERVIETTGKDLFEWLSTVTFRRENHEIDESKKTPSLCRKVCGTKFHDNVGNGTELISFLRNGRRTTTSGKINMDIINQLVPKSEAQKREIATGRGNMNPMSPQYTNVRIGSTMQPSRMSTNTPIAATHAFSQG